MLRTWSRARQDPVNQGTGQNSEDPGEARTSKRTRTAPLLVERVTAMRGQGIAAHQEPKSIASPDPGGHLQ